MRAVLRAQRYHYIGVITHRSSPSPLLSLGLVPSPDDRRCIVWELGATARKRVIPLAAAGVAVALGRGDVTIADKSGAVTTYSTQTAQAIRTATFGHPIRAASFGPDGMVCLTLGGVRGGGG
jgi:hypothetical protein